MGPHQKIAVLNGYDRWGPSLSNHFWVKILSGIQDVALATGVQVACLDMNDLDKPHWADGPFDGFIGAIPRATPGRIAHWRKVQKNRPWVSIMSMPEEKGELYVGPDEVDAAEKIAAHLAAEGHRSCFFATLSDEKYSVARREAFARFAAAQKIMTLCFDYSNDYQQHGPYAPDHGARDLLAQYTKHRPHAIVFESDFFASRFERLALENGVRIPQDLGLVGMNDAPEYPLPVALTTTRHDGATIGREAARLLFAEIRGEKTKSPILVEDRLVVRRSSLRKNLLGQTREAFETFVTAQIKAHSTYPETLRLLPQTLGMGPSAFSKRFKEVFGRGFVSHVNHYRIALAANLLTTTSDSVTAIALGTGFNNHTNFMTFFRREMGCTPSEYRAGRGPRPHKKL